MGATQHFRPQPDLNRHTKALAIELQGQIKKRPAGAERFVLWPLGLESDGPSPIVRGGFQTDTRAGILKISKFYFSGNLCIFLQQFPHRGDMYSCFLFLAQSRVFFYFAWKFVAGGEDLFLCSLGEWAYSYRAALFARPAPPFIGGCPRPPILPTARPGFLPIKK